MGRGQAFAAALDAALGGWQAEAPIRAGFASRVATATLFFHLEPPSRPVPVAAYTPAERPTPKPAPPHTLTPTQQQAYDTFQRLGARLDAAFTRRELRTAFRRLALRYHPDRHPGSGAGETSRLSDAFRQLTAAYEQLHPLPARL